MLVDAPPFPAPGGAGAVLAQPQPPRGWLCFFGVGAGAVRGGCALLHPLGRGSGGCHPCSSFLRHPRGEAGALFAASLWWGRLQEMKSFGGFAQGEQIQLPPCPCTVPFLVRISQSFPLAGIPGGWLAWGVPPSAGIRAPLQVPGSCGKGSGPVSVGLETSERAGHPFFF